MNFGQTAKSVLATVAPMLGTAIGGPFGGLAGTMLATALGSSDPKTMETAITSTDPNVLLKLKQADLDFQAQMASLGISDDKLRFDDIANARQREQIVKDYTPRILAYGVTAGFFGTLGTLLKMGKPVGGDVILVLLGSLGTAWTGIISFYFGSSAGSASKTEAINKMISK